MFTKRHNMKRLLSITFLLASTLLLHGQIEEFINNAEDKKSDRLMLQFYVDNWLDKPDSIDMEGLSRGFAFYFMHEWKLGNSNFSIASGTGISAHNIFYDAMIVEDSLNRSVFVPMKGISYKRNKLTTAYIDIPLEFRFKAKPGKKGNSFKMSVGIKAGYMLNNHTKYVGDGFMLNKTEKVKLKEHNINNISDLRYGVTGRIGIGSLAISGYYALTPLFEEDEGPQVVPFSVGITLLGL